MTEPNGSLRRAETEDGDEYFVDESNGAYELIDGKHKRVGKWNEQWKLVQKEVVVVDPPPIRMAPASYGSSFVRRRTNHVFEVKDDDHCETPQEAYDDIGPMLHQLAGMPRTTQSTYTCTNVEPLILLFVPEKLGKTPETLQIYDPYYCAGSYLPARRHQA